MILASLAVAASLALPPAPQTVARMISEQLLSTDPAAYNPVGCDSKKVYGGGKYIHYSVASLWVVSLECAEKTGDKELERRLVELYESCSMDDPDLAKLHFWHHVDHDVGGAVPLCIARLTGDAKCRELGLKFADGQWAKPDIGDVLAPFKDVGNREYAERLAFWEQGLSPVTRLWIDDMYMISFLQIQAYKLTKDKVYLERAAREMVFYLDKLPREDGLYTHSDRTPLVWGRGDGWMAASQAMLLEYGDLLPDEDRAIIRINYLKMMSTLLKFQRDSGLWGQLVDDADSWDETSCSAMFAYAMAVGVRNGWLDRTVYGAAVEKAYAALVARLDPHGNLGGVCVGTGASASREFYLKRPVANGDPHGQAAMLWLCKELMK